MPKAHQVSSNFTAGELSPFLVGRHDIQKYFAGAREIRNFRVQPQGGLYRRMGFKWIASVGYPSSGKHRLIPFEFSTLQAYLLEFTQNIMRIYKNGVLVTTAYTGGSALVTGATKANPCVITTNAAHSLVPGEKIYLIGLGGMTELNNREYIINTTPTATTFTIKADCGQTINSTNYTTYTTGGGLYKAVELVVPWANADLDALQWAQTADELYVCHEDYAPRVISRTSDSSWSIATFSNEYGPYGAENTTKTQTMQLVWKTGFATITGITQANPAVLTYAATGTNNPFGDIWEVGDLIYISGVATMTGINGQTVRVTAVNTGTNALTLDYDGSGAAGPGTGGQFISADYLATCDDLNNNTTSKFFVQADTQEWKLFEYLNGTYMDLAMMAEDVGASNAVTAKVQPWDFITKVDVPPSSESGWTVNPKDPGPSSAPNSGAWKFTYADVASRDDVGKNVRSTNAYWSSGHTYVEGSPARGRAAWGTIVTFTSGDSVVATMAISPFGNGGGSPAVTNDKKHDYRHYDYGSDTTTEYRPTLNNRQILGRVYADFSAFTSADVGRWIRLRLGTQEAHVKITEYIDANNVRVSMLEIPPVVGTKQAGVSAVHPHVFRPVLEADGRTYRWSWGAWHEGSTGGKKNYPKLVAFHEQRLVFANTVDYPQTLWFSAIDDFTNFRTAELDGTVIDTNGITATIAASEINAIEWLSPGATLLLGTRAREWQVRPSQVSQPLTPSNVIIQPQTAIGGEPDIRPFRSNNAHFFLQRGGRKLREMIYSFELDGFTSRDLSVLSEHILRDPTTSQTNKATRIAFKQGTNPIILALLADGQIAICTYEPDQEVVAWARWTASGTSASFEDVVTIPNSDGTDDDIYVVVKRTINGTTTRYIERIYDDFFATSTTTRSGRWYVDGGIEANISASSDIGLATGLEHLEGEAARFTVDGYDELGLSSTRTISAGQISFDSNSLSSVAEVIVGLGYISRVKTMPPEGGSLDGPAQGKIRRIDNLSLRVHDTVNFEYSGDGTNWNEDVFPDGTSTQPPPMVTGIRSVIPGNAFRHYTDGSFWIRQERPYPLNILQLIVDMKVAP